MNIGLPKLHSFAMILFMSTFRRVASFSDAYQAKFAYRSSNFARFSQPRFYFRSSGTHLPALSTEDEGFLRQAIECAKEGLGHTFPNPAVGCLLVNQEDGTVLGKGFHPRAGYPHAEVFALLQAAGHLEDGVAAGQAVVKKQNEQGAILNEVLRLSQQYTTDDGPEQLFEDTLAKSNVTAYVTLEPCSHYGKTPPCAVTLALAQASRVVVGFRDPNPKVDGGGVELLREVGVAVDMAEGALSEACAELVTNFVKRITPRDETMINGSKRRALRALSNRKKSEGTLAEMSWTGRAAPRSESAEVRDSESDLVLQPEWMEALDDILWKEELICIRLNKAVKKKKEAKVLGTRIAAELTAHVAQTVGHTVLLYRPGIPATLDLDQLVASMKGNDDNDKDDDNEEEE